MDFKITKKLKFTFSIFFLFICLPVMSQQFNSDNYLSKPKGVATIILTGGERNNMLMTTFSLFQNWEFTLAAYIYNSDKDPTTDEGYSTSYYFKYMLFENKAKTGGIAFKGGTGLEPGLLIDNVGLEDAFKTYWINSPATIPLFNNIVSIDLMPGASYTIDYEDEGNPAWSFTYSSRIGWYPFDPKFALVGEVFGSAGEANTKPEYKAGLR